MKNRINQGLHSFFIFTICVCFVFVFNLGSDVSNDEHFRVFDYSHLRDQSLEFNKNINTSNYQNYVCLTFDDGPDPVFTPAIVRELNRRGQRATFFLIGKYIQNQPFVTKLLIDGQHEVGNHTWSHMKLSHASFNNTTQQLMKTYIAIKNNFGVQPLWYRPPYGLTNSSVTNLAARDGMKLLMWDVDTSDYLNPSPTTLLNRVYRKSYNGAIILMHSNKKNTCIALPRILDYYEKNKYLLVTASEWYQLKYQHKSINEILLSRLDYEVYEIPSSHNNADEVIEFYVEPSIDPNEDIDPRSIVSNVEQVNSVENVFHDEK